RGFRASIGQTTVTSAFGANGAARTATLRVGTTRGLRYGTNTLYVRTTGAKGKRRYTQRSFVLARPAVGLIGGATATRRAQGGAWLWLGLARAGLDVTLIAGGKRTALPGTGRTRTLRLSADEGLRPGSNRLRVRVLDSTRGVYQEKVVLLRLPADAPV